MAAYFDELSFHKGRVWHCQWLRLLQERIGFNQPSILIQEVKNVLTSHQQHSVLWAGVWMIKMLLLLKPNRN